MLRCLYPGPFPDTSWRRFVRHPDPDALIGLTARFPQKREQGAANAQELSREFSEVVSSIRVGLTHKWTRPNRLAGPTLALCERLSIPKEGKPLQFLDVGGSDGITTLEAVRMLEERLPVPVHACLIDPFIRLLRYRSGSVVEYRTPDQSPVMVRLGAIGLQLSSLDTSRDLLSRALGGWYLNRTGLRDAMQVDATISLVNPLVATDPSVSVLEWSVLRDNPALVGQFHAVRASNVLIHSYFSPSQLETALSHLYSYLVEDGLLLISRSHFSGDSEIDRGSIWRKQAGRFVHQHSFGSGAEIAEIVDRLRF